MTNTRVSTLITAKSLHRPFLVLLVSLLIALGAFAPTVALATTVRDEAPEGSNPWYYSDVNPYYRQVGLAPKPTPVDGVYVTGNCTWYAWGRASEMAGTPLSLTANDPMGMWYEAQTSDYETGGEPRVGAIAVGYSGGSGHVSVVEKVVNGVPYVSESGYREKRRWPGYENVEFHYGELDSWMDTTIGYIYVLKGAPNDVETYDDYGDEQDAVWERIWGESAYDTMRAAVQSDGVFEDGRGGTVVLATGDGYWDALAASGLAGVLDAPIVITPTHSLCDQAADELARLDPSQVLVMGGSSAVSDAVVGRLERSHDVTRVWGQEADDTAVEIYKYGDSLDAWGNTAIVATCYGYWDALSIAPYAYAHQVPLFLTNKETGLLSDATLRAIEQGGFRRVVIVGGTSVVPAQVEEQLGGVGEVLRLWGESALDTSAEIAAWGIDEENMGISHLAVATSYGYWDALTAAPVAGKTGSVIVLVDSEGGYQAFDRVYDPSLVTHGHVLGGTSVIPEHTWAYITAA